MTQLADEGWIAPGSSGPSRRVAIGFVAFALAAAVAWSLGATRRFGDEPTRLVVRLGERGTAEVVGPGSDTATPLRRSIRTSGDTQFVVFDGRVSGVGHGPLLLDVRPQVGLDGARIARRVVPPSLGATHARVLLTMRASLVPGLPRQAPSGSLEDVTAEVDEAVAAARSDRLLLERLRDGWWWIVPLGGLLVAATLALWLRSRQRFLSMRRPGPGTAASLAPPSSLDPVSAAVLVAGARPVDEAAAFAGHVLDLVERRQLRLRRNVEESLGAPGAQLGLAHVEEDGPSDDPAVAALRSVAQPDGVTVDLPTDAARVRVAAASTRDEWHEHLAARARFERMVEQWPWQRVATAAAAVATFALLGVVGGVTAERAGARAAALLVVALATPLALTLAAWARDARRWRVIARARRLERAQWLAWRSSVGAADGPTVDPRNLPLVVATGPIEGIVPDAARPTAVALEAVTLDTVHALRALVDRG